MAHFSATGWTLSSSVHIRRGSYHPWKAWRMGVVEVSSFALVGITSFPAVEGCEEGWGAKCLCLTRNVSEGQATSRPEFIKCLNFTKISCLFWVVWWLALMNSWRYTTKLLQMVHHHLFGVDMSWSENGLPPIWWVSQCVSSFSHKRYTNSDTFICSHGPMASLMAGRSVVPQLALFMICSPFDVARFT